MKNLMMVVAMIGLVLISGCGVADDDAIQELAQSEAPRMNEPFVNGYFEMTVTDVLMGVQTIRPANPESERFYRYAFGKDWQKDVWLTPENGQFVIVNVKFTNISDHPELLEADHTTIVDQDERTYSAASEATTDFTGDNNGSIMQPGTSSKGAIIFDVPWSLTEVSQVLVLSDYTYDKPNLDPTSVNVKGQTLTSVEGSEIGPVPSVPDPAYAAARQVANAIDATNLVDRTDNPKLGTEVSADWRGHEISVWMPKNKSAVNEARSLLESGDYEYAEGDGWFIWADSQKVAQDAVDAATEALNN